MLVFLSISTHKSVRQNCTKASPSLILSCNNLLTRTQIFTTHTHVAHPSALLSSTRCVVYNVHLAFVDSNDCFTRGTSNRTSDTWSIRFLKFINIVYIPRCIPSPENPSLSSLARPTLYQSSTSRSCITNKVYPYHQTSSRFVLTSLLGNFCRG